ncbi:MAG TPA: hypothetical protein PKH07_13970, partial [bacterium]|nr:hypothetical protein [bacterium]
MRKNSSVCLALFSLAVALVATAPVFAESLSAKQIIRQSAMAYQQMETYQDKSMMQIDLGDTMASMPGNVSEAQKQQMLEMTKMQMDFGFKRPRQFAMNLKSFMFNADTSCDGKTLTYLIANLMGQPLNQYQQRNVENASIDKVLDEMASSLAMQGQMKGQSHQSNVVYSMLLADNPLEAFSKMIDSVSPEAVREKKQIRMNADQSEFKDVYILQGNFAVDQTYGKGITAV